MTEKQMSFYCLHLKFTKRAISRFSVRPIYLSLCVLLDTAAAESKKGRRKEVKVTKMVIKIEEKCEISGV